MTPGIDAASTGMLLVVHHGSGGLRRIARKQCATVPCARHEEPYAQESTTPLVLSAGEALFLDGELVCSWERVVAGFQRLRASLTK